MTVYTPKWDLGTIPEKPFNSEVGRRRRAKGNRVTREVLLPCKHCGQTLNARQRRIKCIHCGRTQNVSA